LGGIEVNVVYKVVYMALNKVWFLKFHF